MRRAFLAVTFVLLALTGCGYSTVRKSSGLFSGRSVHVEMFANSTYQPEVEGKLRLALVDELSIFSPGGLTEGNVADLLLSGDVESLIVENAAFSQQDKAVIYRIVLTVQARVSDRKSGRVVWKTTESVREEYPAGTDMALQRNARDTAIAAACREMARHLVTQMSRAF